MMYFFRNPKPFEGLRWIITPQNSELRFLKYARIQLNKDGKIDLKDSIIFGNHECEDDYCAAMLSNTYNPCLCDLDNKCEAEEGENCENCPEDCPCPAGEFCCPGGICSIRGICPL